MPFGVFWHPFGILVLLFAALGPQVGTKTPRGRIGGEFVVQIGAILSSIFALFGKTSVLGRLFRRSVFCIGFFIVFWPPRGTLKP